MNRPNIMTSLIQSQNFHKSLASVHLFILGFDPFVFTFCWIYFFFHFRSFWMVLTGVQISPQWKTTSKSTTPSTLQLKNWWAACKKLAAMRCVHNWQSNCCLYYMLQFLMIFFLFLYQADVSPNFRSNYSETLAKLEHQYCKLLVCVHWKTVKFTLLLV